MYQYLTYQTRTKEDGQSSASENLRKVFISYKKSDNVVLPIRDFIANIVLKCANVAIWKDANLTPGLDYDVEIKKALAESDAVILLLTEHILESDYVWQKEIAAAQAMEKGIIPLCMGISKEDLQIANEKLNHRHCLACPVNENGQFCTNDSFEADLKRALTVHVMDVDLVEKINQFFAAEKHRISLRYLSYEQIYYMGCGYLNGIGTIKNHELSIPLLKSVLLGYDNDEEFIELKRTVAGKIYFYYAERLNFPLMHTYAILALQYGNLHVINELNALYNEDQYPEFLFDAQLRSAFYQAVKKYGLCEGYATHQNPQKRISKNAIQKVTPTEQKRSVIEVDGHEFYLAAKKEQKLLYGDNYQVYYTIYLMRDYVAIDAFECSNSPGPGNAVFLNYDPQDQVLQILESDFDYRSIETDYCEYTYRNIFEDEIERQIVYLGSHKYAARLPYSTRRWKSGSDSLFRKIFNDTLPNKS